MRRPTSAASAASAACTASHLKANGSASMCFTSCCPPPPPLLPADAPGQLSGAGTPYKWKQAGWRHPLEHSTTQLPAGEPTMWGFRQRACRPGDAGVTAAAQIDELMADGRRMLR